MTTTTQEPGAQARSLPEPEFCEEDHSYHLNGRRVPGVTEVISRIAPHRSVGEWYLERGSAVHAAIALAVRGELDWSSVDDRINGRVNSVLSFLHAASIKPTFLEQRLASERYQFAGTLDFLGFTPCGTVVLCDWKGSLCPQAEIQLGAYSLLLAEQKITCGHSVAVETRDDGSYKCRWFTARQAQLASQTFLSFLTARNWLEKNNIKSK